MRVETRVGMAITAGAVLVVAVAGGITPGRHSIAAGAPPATDANGVPIAAKAPYDCRPDDAPHLNALGSHQHAQGFDTEAIAVLSPSVCRSLEEQLAITAKAARIAPTLGDAERLHYKMVGFYSPGLGMHMEIPQGIDGRFDPAHPEYLLYGGNVPSAPIVGFAYEVEDAGGIPALFAGGHDVPHSHADRLAQPGKSSDLIPGQGTCTQANAIGAHNWLVHAWAVPGKPSPWGVFADANPALTPHGYDLQHPMTAHSFDCFYETRAEQAPYPGCKLTSPLAS